MDKQLHRLIRAYDFPGPRYTSYPPAPLFSSSFSASDCREAIVKTETTREHRDISLYFHIPFCDSLCYFCGCTTIISQNADMMSRYLKYVKKEIDLLSPLIDTSREVDQMHWGGGTPTSLTPSQIEDLGLYIRNAFKVRDTAEAGVEIDPRDISFHHLKALRSIGFNRISMGVQDFDPRVQQAVNRNQSEFKTRQAVDWGRELGFQSLNIDLIYGLPMQTVDSFNRTLDKIIDISPERIAVYNFAYVPWIKKHQRLIHTEDLPSPETKLSILTSTIERLIDAGYVYIGMDHFAKPDDELAVSQRNKTLNRNFQGYSTKAGADLYGIGLSAISHFGTYYAQNAKTLHEYYLALDSGNFATHVGYEMTPDDEIRKFVIMKLMCQLTLEKSIVEKKFDIVFDEYFSESIEALQPLINDGLIVETDDAVTVTNEGRLFLRNIALCFDAYTAKVPQAKPLYSRTI